MLNFNQLRVFCQTARYLSCTRAAEKLYITQPAVTAQIKLLEDSCNLKLFKKKGRRIFLTDEGKTLYDYAAKVFEYEKEIEDLIDDLKELKRGMLRLGTSKSYARYFMPLLITSFRGAYPHIKIHLDEGSSLDMIHSLLDLRNEVAVIAKVEDNPEICFIPFSREELVLILAPEHPLAKKRYITLAELAREPLIMTERGSATRKLVIALFDDNGISPEILMETGNAEFIKQLVQRGDGVSFIVKEAAAVELQEKKLVAVPIKGQRIFLDVSIAYLKKQRLSPSAQAFLDILLKIAPKEKPDQGIRTIMARMLSQWK
ncbi:MAG: LysR family transcriptional regulator [Desulfobacteraceae bacterium]|jgi:DNA-binding transcriptional LysR family regulator